MTNRVDTAPKWPGADFKGRNHAATTYYLLANEAAWIHRRVERLELLDKGRLRRQMSVDFTAPDFAGDGIRYPPLSLVVKHVFRNLDVRDESGRPIPVLTREQNGPIAAAILLGNARQILEASTLAHPQKRPSVDLIHDLEVIVGQRFVGAAEVAKAFERLTAPDSTLGDYPGRRVLADDETFIADIREFYEQFLLLVDLPLKPGERRIIKISYEQQLGSLRERWALRPYHSLRWLLETAGILTYRTGAVAQSALDSRSYHAEIEAPAGVFLARTRLRAHRTEELGWWARLRGRQYKPLWVERGNESAHLYTFGLSPDEFDAALIDINISLRPGGLLMAAFSSSLLTTLILWAGVYLHDRGVGPYRTEATALLVILPAVFVAFLVPGEHPLTRRMFKGLRLMIMLSAAISFTSAALLAINLQGRPNVDLRLFPLHHLSALQGWRYLGWASLVITGVITVSLGLAWLRLYALPVWRTNGRVSD